MGKVRLLLDMDPGVDDALALMLALRTPETEIVGIGTSCGNVGAYESALNVLRVLEAVRCRRTFPVVVGLSEPLTSWRGRKLPDAREIHGPDGLGGVRLGKPPKGQPDRGSAVDLICETYNQRSDVRLVVTGPLTNVAEALRWRPAIARNIPRLIWMGGAYTVPGNIAPYAEFNCWMDPVAASEVFASEISITAVGLDVCLQCPLARRDLEVSLRPDDGWELGRFLLELTEHYMRFYHRAEGFWGCYLHDPLALAVAIWPDLVWTRPFHVQFVTNHESLVYGMTVIDRRARRFDEPPTGPEKDIAVQVDAHQFRQRFLRALRPPDDWEASGASAQAPSGHGLL